jgi:hypothetical protein
MNIVREYAPEYKTLKIVAERAEYVGNLAIKVFFADGKETIVDFKPFLEKSQHPDIRKYLNEDTFKCFKIIDGNLNWNDYDMIFPVSDLYDGIIK